MIVNSVFLALDKARSFDLFTSEIGAWWPADRRHTKDPTSEIFLLRSGRFFERAADGDEVDLGCVTAWQEPDLIILDFHIATGPDHPTQVEIRFESEADGTRITVTHRAKPESAHLWDDRAPRYSASWRIVLDACLRYAWG